MTITAVLVVVVVRSWFEPAEHNHGKILMVAGGVVFILILKLVL